MRYGEGRNKVKGRKKDLKVRMDEDRYRFIPVGVGC